MEVSSEYNEHVREFWIQRNGMLLEIKGSEYKFNPSSIKVDQTSSNINSIAAVYRE